MSGRPTLTLTVHAIGALVRMAAIEASLRTSTLPVTCARLGLRLDLEAPTAPPAPLVLQPWARLRVRAAVAVARRWPAGDTCLRRCLLIGHRLRRLDPVLRMGVRRAPDGTFVAHSWLEIDGLAIDPDAADYTLLRSTHP